MADYNYRTYSFQSVGEKLKDFREKNRLDVKTVIPISIKTPLEFGNSQGGLLLMHKSIKATIKDNLKNLLLTNHGERLGHYDMGANLQELTFELGKDEFDEIAIGRILDAANKYMPFINLIDFSVTQYPEFSSPALACVGIKVSYSVPQANISIDALEVMLFAAG